ncbi:MAG TPA: GGDEF domain-containing protein [Solirubrobacteraceae bacterium]|nr:GGDEF domain-containing protein [Solirubrobacteraceae bacterium]
MRGESRSTRRERGFAALGFGAYAALVLGVLTTGIVSAVALLALGIAAGIYIHRLRLRVRRLRTIADELRASQIERAELISDFERARRTDSVTGLGNHNHLDSALPRLVTEAGSSMSSLAVLVLDLEGLGAYGDKYGEDATDRALKSLAADWQGHMRINDVLVRVSAAEFVAVLPACSPQNARRVAGRLLSASRRELGCAVGVASWDGGESHEELLARAGAATRVAEPEPEPAADDGREAALIAD